jgi:hypothetical protein
VILPVQYRTVSYHVSRFGFSFHPGSPLGRFHLLPLRRSRIERKSNDIEFKAVALYGANYVKLGGNGTLGPSGDRVGAITNRETDRR